MRLRELKCRVYVEFNTLHSAEYLKEHPDAAPVGVDGKVCPPPEGWQGLCPTHVGYRRDRMKAFERVLASYAIDGIWLDYHHAHSSWERAEPVMPDTCFCARCLGLFSRDTGITLPDLPPGEVSQWILSRHKRDWVRWRCGVLTDWVREFRDTVDAIRPGVLLGTFHCPWTDSDRGGARIDKLHIDLKSQAPYIDVFSPMPYHARFGHAQDPEWVHRQTRWLGEYLGIRGKPGERKKIWPIVQLSDWGENVPVAQVRPVLDYGTRAPATGVTVFAWGRLQEQWDKVEELGTYYRSIRGTERKGQAPK